MYPGWFNWQGSFIQVCFPCVQTVTGPATPWTITSEEIPEGEGAVRLAGMVCAVNTAAASSGEGHPPPPDSATEEFAIVPYNDLASMAWKVPEFEDKQPDGVQGADLEAWQTQHDRLKARADEIKKLPEANLVDGKWFRVPWFKLNEDLLHETNFKAFKKYARRAWLQHQAWRTGNFVHNVREMHCNKTMDHIAKSNPGTDFTATARRRILTAQAQ